MKATERADPALASYQEGPFPTVEVPDAPPAMTALLWRLGIKLTPKQIADYERVRAYTGYVGIVITTPLEMARSLPAIEEKPKPVRHSRSSPLASETGRSGLDPHDLGDD